MRVKIIWRGEEIQREARDAQHGGLDESARVAAARARSSHPGWKSVTGAAERSIASVPPRSIRTGMRAGVGWGVPYFHLLEIGFRGRPGDNTIRRAVDVEGGHLGERIAARMKS